MSSRRSTQGTLDDAELVRRARSGENSAFDRLVERYQRRAASIAFRLLGDLHDALEVCQDAFVRAYRGLDTLADAGRFGPWFLRIVTNVSLNFRRARGTRARHYSLEECILDGNGGRGRSPAEARHLDERPGAELAAAELGRLVHQAICELPDRQRAALVLFSIEQLPQRVVAEILQCSVEAVKWHVFQARRKLRVRLAQHL